MRAKINAYPDARHWLHLCMRAKIMRIRIRKLALFVHNGSPAAGHESMRAKIMGIRIRKLALFVHNGSPAAGHESMRAKINAYPDARHWLHLCMRAKIMRIRIRKHWLNLYTMAPLPCPCDSGIPPRLRHSSPSSPAPGTPSPAQKSNS
jgi:hypothetical protein